MNTHAKTYPLVLSRPVPRPLPRAAHRHRRHPGHRQYAAAHAHPRALLCLLCGWQYGLVIGFAARCCAPPSSACRPLPPWPWPCPLNWPPTVSSSAPSTPAPQGRPGCPLHQPAHRHGGRPPGLGPGRSGAAGPGRQRLHRAGLFVRRSAHRRARHRAPAGAHPRRHDRPRPYRRRAFPSRRRMKWILLVPRRKRGIFCRNRACYFRPGCGIL